MHCIEKATLLESVSIIKFKKGTSNYAVAYDADFNVMRDVTSTLYALYENGIGAKGKTNEENALLEIKKFLTFLKGTTIRLVKDKTLADYRDQRLDEVMKSQKSKGDELTAKYSVNVYLVYVYVFLAKYYELYGNKSPLLMGCTNNHQIRTGMFDSEGNRVSKANKKKGGEAFYPQSFDVPNREGKTLKYEQVPTELEYIELIEHIKDIEKDPFIRERNQLIVKFARKSSMRRISIASLNSSQFNDISPAEKDGSMSVVPPKQKYSYQKSMEIDYSLSLEVSSYINFQLKPHLENISKKNTWCGALFVNETNGKRMTRARITRIIADYAKALGWSRGKRLHAFRHLYAGDEYEREYERQLNITPDNPSAAERATKVHLRGRLTHNSMEAQDTYLTNMRLKNSAELKKKHHEIEKLKVHQRAKEQKERQRLERIIKENNIDLDIVF